MINLTFDYVTSHYRSFNVGDDRMYSSLRSDHVIEHFTYIHEKIIKIKVS